MTSDIPPARSSALERGDILFDRYLIRSLAGRGGQSVVYEAEHLALGKTVAIKEVLRPSNEGPAAEEAIRSFHEEARILGRLEHRSIPRVFDCFTENGRSYVVMDFIHGETLAEIFARTAGPFPERKVLRWTSQICDVLSYLHSQSPPIIFRDLKPSNIMVNEQGHVQLIDFGIARFFKPGQPRDTAAMGTDGYCAPEQHGTGQTDARSDVFSLGACIHTLLTGHDPSSSPYRFPRVRELNTDVSPQVDEAVATCLQFDVGRRFQTIAEAKAALLAGAEDPPTTDLPRHAPAVRDTRQKLQNIPGSTSTASTIHPIGVLLPIIIGLMVAFAAAPDLAVKTETTLLVAAAVIFGAFKLNQIRGRQPG